MTLRVRQKPWTGMTCRPKALRAQPLPPVEVLGSPLCGEDTMDHLVIVENIDTGWTTLHRAECVHAQRANITHPATPFWLAAVDRACKVCHAEAPHSSKQI